MSELKTRFIDDTYVEYYNTGKHDLAQVYLKTEVDQYIAELEEKHKMEVEQLLLFIEQLKRAARTLRKKLNRRKRKFCLAMAKWCESENYTSCWYHENSERCEWTEKWHKRWLELAKKANALCKEAK